MDIKAKSPVILLVILMLISLFAAGTGFYLYHKEYAKNVELEEKIEELSNKERITEAKFLEAQRILSLLEAKFRGATDQINNLTNELNQAKTSKEDTLSQLKQAKADLEEQKGLRLDLEDKLNKVRSQVDSMQNKLDALESEKKNLEPKVKNLEANPQGVELGKIVVNPEAIAANSLYMKQAASVEQDKEVAPAEKSAKGKVLVVNKEYNFVVISLGSKDGVKLGQVFSISHENNYIGDVKIEKLHDSMAAASFLSDEIKNRVNEGDKVVKKG